MHLINPNKYRGYSDCPATNTLLEAVINWFETKGLKSLKYDWHHTDWNYSFVDFMQSEQALATLMTPTGYAEGAAWDTRRNIEFAEITGFYGITYWYTFQVSMLGLGPIFNGDNEKVKQRAAELLMAGKVFAFGLSEKEHGADIYSSDMLLIPQADGTYLARGDKYYIGNGNEAALVSTFAKNSETGDYVFFVVDSKHPKYECVKNTVHSQNYVAEFRLHDYPITDDDILSTGQKAWDDMLNTINYCKFNLGFGSIGLVTHAFYEALNHASGRELYARKVTDFPQIKRLFTDSYCRLMAMKLFAYRAADYLRSATATDRRYLLFNPIVKMKVTMQGERVVADLFDVVAAKGFENEPFFEIAAREVGMLPKLEGTAHVNMALIVKFMHNYFFNPLQYPQIPQRKDHCNDAFLFHQGATRGLGNIRFHDYKVAYSLFSLPNIELFKQQISAFKRLLTTAGPDQKQIKNIDYMLGLGELFTLVVYGQLILENAELEKIDTLLLNQIFAIMVREFSNYAVDLHGKAANSCEQQAALLGLIKAPLANVDEFDRLWEQQIFPLVGQYQLAD